MVTAPSETAVTRPPVTVAIAPSDVVHETEAPDPLEEGHRGRGQGDAGCDRWVLGLGG
jgi:hypothetical protein